MEKHHFLHDKDNNVGENPSPNKNEEYKRWRKTRKDEIESQTKPLTKKDKLLNLFYDITIAVYILCILTTLISAVVGVSFIFTEVYGTEAMILVIASAIMSVWPDIVIIICVSYSLWYTFYKRKHPEMGQKPFKERLFLILGIVFTAILAYVILSSFRTSFDDYLDKKEAEKSLETSGLGFATIYSDDISDFDGVEETVKYFTDYDDFVSWMGDNLQTNDNFWSQLADNYEPYTGVGNFYDIYDEQDNYFIIVSPVISGKVDDCWVRNVDKNNKRKTAQATLNYHTTNTDKGGNSVVIWFGNTEDVDQNIAEFTITPIWERTDAISARKILDE